MSGGTREWLAKFLVDTGFVKQYPFYAPILARLEPVDDPSVKVMAVSAYGTRFDLHVNIDFFAEHPEFIRGVLLHEVHHVVLGHVTHPKFRGMAHPDLMELAMEVSANEFIKEALPSGAHTWERYAGFGLQPRQSTMQRYERLAGSRTKGQDLPTPPAFGVDDHHKQGVRSIYPEGGVPDPFAHTWLISALEHADKMIDGLASREWPDWALLAGRRPRRLIEELTDVDRAPEHYLDWRAAVKMFVPPTRTPIHTYARPNRRFPGRLGEIPGRRYQLGQPEHRKPSLIVAIDTSGSMSGRQLAEIGRQLVPLSAAVRMTIAECDAAIRRVYPFKGQLQTVEGRGGTDLRPVFDPAFLREHRADGVIYFTDGGGPYESTDPGIKTLWVLSEPYDFSCPWGEKALLKNREDHRQRRAGRQGPWSVPG